ncbi:serine/threonine-protein kinase [Legionella rubrilucens]|uniref:Serine/threonine-protein kinase n=1 Tax=Legionella rubrilucens TaxID=458 RepID=A0A0W0XW52_9GAMM|nr:protein kinase [Legionella rubrilucens]KTD48674.1 serine/threonine-protein kinase [Legionella rubrilucens]
MITIDPTQLNAAGKKLLFDLMTQAEDTEIAAGKHVLSYGENTEEIFLVHPLLITEKTATCIHAEVLDAPFEKGSYGLVMLSLGKIKSENDMSFKERAHEKQQVIKRIALNQMPEKRIHKEALRTQLGDESLRCKEPVFSKAFGFLRMRKAGDMDLFKLQRHLIKRKIELSLLQYLEISLAIVKAVDELHEKGRIHRDLKPENVMISLSPLTVKLIDFAFSCPNSKTKGKTIKGTLPFLPPEAFFKIKISVAGDIFSLGMTLADFWGDSSMDHINEREADSFEEYYRHRKQQRLELFTGMTMPSEIAEPLNQLLHGMIRFNPDERTPLKSVMSTLTNLIELEKQYQAQLSDSEGDVQEEGDEDKTPGPELSARVG